MRQRFLQLAGLFVWTVAKILVREAAWVTVKAFREREEAKDRYVRNVTATVRTVDLQRRDDTWEVDQISYDGPAGYRVVTLASDRPDRRNRSG